MVNGELEEETLNEINKIYSDGNKNRFKKNEIIKQVGNLSGIVPEVVIIVEN